MRVWIREPIYYFTLYSISEIINLVNQNIFLLAWIKEIIFKLDQEVK